MMNLSYFAAKCTQGGSLFSLPTWYKYLNCDETNAPQLGGLTDIWLVAAAIIEILMFVAGIVAIAWFLFGAIKMILSQGQPDKIAQARQTMIYAFAGLIIATVAARIVGYIGSNL